MFRDGGSIGTTAATAYTDTGLTAETAYSYALSAFDTASPANESGQCSPIVATTTANTIARNASFEIDADLNGRADNWACWDATYIDTAIRNDDYAHTGNYCLRCEPFPDGNPDVYCLQSEVITEPSTEYTIGCWMRASASATWRADGGLFLRYVRFYGTGGDYEGNWGTWNNKVTGSADWEYRETTFTTGSGTGHSDSRIDCFYGDLTAGYGYFDDVVLLAE